MHACTHSSVKYVFYRMLLVRIFSHSGHMFCAFRAAVALHQVSLKLGIWHCLCFLAEKVDAAICRFPFLRQSTPPMGNQNPLLQRKSVRSFPCSDLRISISTIERNTMFFPLPWETEILSMKENQFVFSFSVMKMHHTKRLGKRLHEKTKNVFLYHGFLSLHKCTRCDYKSFVLLNIQIIEHICDLENQNYFLYRGFRLLHKRNRGDY